MTDRPTGCHPQDCCGDPTAHKPAPAAGVAPAADQTETGCCCGEPGTPNTIHRTDGPCYVADRAELRDRIARLSETEQRMLEYALDLADEEVARDGSEFSDEEEDALAELRRLAAGAQQQTDTETLADTLPAWLHQRFDPRGPDWDQLPDDDRAYWEHEAAAVQRAVARGGFRDSADPPAPVAPQPAADSEEETRVVSCSLSVLKRQHGTHRWEPRPGMTGVRCPGYSN